MQFFAIKDIGDINFGELVKDLPGRPNWNPFSTQGQYVTAILKSYKTLSKYGVDNALRLGHFLGQGLIETGFLRYKAENLNYSAEGLRKIFPKYFTEEEARQYARKPEKIANRVYASRLGNGDEASGDGWRYRGRGFFQLTGRDNYRRYGELAGIDLESDPELIERDLAKSVEVAAAFFGKTGLGEYADQNDAAAVSRGVNRGNPKSKYKAHGEAERIIWTRKALALVKNPDSVVGDGVGAGIAASIEAGLDLGDRGEVVKEVQQKLGLLGYAVGQADGIYGRNTRRAVIAFQDEYGLPTTGIVDAETNDVLNDVMTDTRKAQPIEREIATEKEVVAAGADDVRKTNQVGGAGAVTGAVGAAAAANEAGLVEPVVKKVTEVLDGNTAEAVSTDATLPVEETTEQAGTDDGATDPVTPPATSDVVTTTTAEVEVPAGRDTAPVETETDYTLMIVLGAVALLGLFVWIRSRNIVDDKVEDYRDGRYV